MMDLKFEPLDGATTPDILFQTFVDGCGPPTFFAAIVDFRDGACRNMKTPAGEQFSKRALFGAKTSRGMGRRTTISEL